MPEVSKIEKPNVATRELWQVAVAGAVDQVESLLAGGAEINRSNPAGFTALMLAAYHSHREMVKALIEHGADVNAGSGSLTAVKLADDAGHEEIVSLLLAHGGRKNQKPRARAKPAVGHTPKQTIAETPAPTPAESPRVPEVRTLHEPPDIWEMVQEAPAGFDSRSALMGNFTSRKTLVLAAIALVFAGAVVFTFIALPSWSWTAGDAASPQPNDNNAKTAARVSATPSLTVNSSAAQPSAARSASNPTTSNTANAPAFDQIAPRSNQSTIDSAATKAVGVPVASSIRPAAKPRRQNANGPGAANRANLSDPVPTSNSSIENTATATRTESKETAPTSTTPNPTFNNEKGGSNDDAGRAQPRDKKEGNRGLSPELIGPAKSSPSPKPRVIPWP